MRLSNYEIQFSFQSNFFFPFRNYILVLLLQKSSINTSSIRTVFHLASPLEERGNFFCRHHLQPLERSYCFKTFFLAKEPLGPRDGDNSPSPGSRSSRDCSHQRRVSRCSSSVASFRISKSGTSGVDRYRNNSISFFLLFINLIDFPNLARSWKNQKIQSKKF